MSRNITHTQGLVVGSFAADALSLGVHWIYDTDELAAKHGRVTDFHAPDGDSYHPKKAAGEQSHVGDQAVRLMHFLEREERWDAASFFEDWKAMWADYGDYFDHATKETLSTGTAASSNELAGPARIAPLVAFLSEQEEDDVVKAALEQTALTHQSPAAAETTEFLARACYRLIHGAELETTLERTAPTWAWDESSRVLEKSAIEAIGDLGQSCPIPAALPGVLYLARKFGDDLETAFIENAMAGGDNCARGLVLGMLLGAAHGVDAIPARWREGLKAI